MFNTIKQDFFIILLHSISHKSRGINCHKTFFLKFLESSIFRPKTAIGQVHI